MQMQRETRVGRVVSERQEGISLPFYWYNMGVGGRPGYTGSSDGPGWVREASDPGRCWLVFRFLEGDTCMSVGRGRKGACYGAGENSIWRGRR